MFANVEFYNYLYIEFIIKVILIYSVIMKGSRKKTIFMFLVVFTIIMECLSTANQ
jgi:hypothetical protein